MTRPVRHAVVGVALCLLWLALLPAHAGLAQDRSPSRTPKELWKAYPLNTTAARGDQPSTTSSLAARAATNREPIAAASSRNEGGVPVLVPMMLVLLLVGGALTFRATRRWREREPPATAARPGTSRVEGSVAPVPPRGGSGRFIQAGPGNGSPRAMAVVGSGRVGDGRPATSPAATPPSSGPLPVAPPSAAASPPDPRRAWTAEIEWRHADGESRFCAVARGAGAVTVAQSPPLEWPPTGPAAVQAMTDAAETLSAILVGAGWKALPPGHSWYAKRFAWQPRSPAPVRAKPPAAAAAQPQPQPQPQRRRRRLFALVCVLIALGTLLALELGSRDDKPRAEKPPATTRVTAAPATDPNVSSGIDPTIPLLVILGVISAALVVRADL